MLSSLAQVKKFALHTGDKTILFWDTIPNSPAVHFDWYLILNHSLRFESQKKPCMLDDIIPEGAGILYCRHCVEYPLMDGLLTCQNVYPSYERESSENDLLTLANIQTWVNMARSFDRQLNLIGLFFLFMIPCVSRWEHGCRILLPSEVPDVSVTEWLPSQKSIQINKPSPYKYQMQ